MASFILSTKRTCARQSTKCVCARACVHQRKSAQAENIVLPRRHRCKGRGLLALCRPRTTRPPQARPSHLSDIYWAVARRNSTDTDTDAADLVTYAGAVSLTKKTHTYSLRSPQVPPDPLWAHRMARTVSVAVVQSLLLSSQKHGGNTIDPSQVGGIFVRMRPVADSGMSRLKKVDARSSRLFVN